MAPPPLQVFIKSFYHGDDIGGVADCGGGGDGDDDISGVGDGVGDGEIIKIDRNPLTGRSRATNWPWW